MKKYTYYKVGLFISLLGFSTLTSCVNTRDCVNKKQNTHYHSLVNPTGSYSLHRFYQNNPVTAIAAKVVGGVILLGGVLVPGWFIVKHFTNQSSALATGTCPVPGQDFMPSEWNITATRTHQIEELAAFVHKAIEKYKESDNADDSIIDELAVSINDTIENRKPDWINTFAVPYTISDPMLVDDQTLKSIEQAHCDPKLIACLMEKGLSPDAKASDGFPLLYHAIGANNTAALEYLIDKGAKTNPTNSTGILEYGLMLEQQNIVDYLINRVDKLHKEDITATLDFAAKLPAAKPNNVDTFSSILKVIDPCKYIDKDKLESYLKVEASKEGNSTAPIQPNRSKLLQNRIEALYPADKKCPGA
ncbi:MULTISPECIES: ankyrin repeat domain-containing protein [Candidatus Cardinium]|uniref:ankyrin repeat domain-containing protein n=1 Tax=Candidatus Cardinium TaxID=273135 RepID=UPI001FA97456|nr:MULTISPECIES: ankyrin repeat domain-containing protein [Cardinium]